MANRSVLISGASIAGPVVAYWLQKHGLRTTIVERAPGLRPGGQAVDLRGAGRTVVERMGLMDEVKSVALQQRGIAWVDASGRVLAELSTDSFGGEGFVSEIEILRGDLSQVFNDAIAPSTEYLFDDTITAIEQDDNGVRVSFEKAAARAFDFVIGADGLHSAVRNALFAPESQCLRPADCYIAWFTVPADIDLGGWFMTHNSPGGRVASIRPGRLASESKAALAFRSPPLTYDRRNTAEQRELVASRFADVGWHVPAILKAMRDASDFFFDSMARVHLSSWSNGRVALIGDAAYSPTPLGGLGTSLALVGAYVLAGELAATDDHRHAFERYDEIMRPYVTVSQKLPGGGAGGFAPKSRFAIRAVTTSMRWASRWPIRNMLASQFGKAAGIDLPDYPQTAGDAHAV